MATDGPADTTMMRIVHDALRRDLARAQATLSDPAPLSPHRRRAIGDHLTWLMRFLEAHHASEDDGLYPLVRERAGDASDALAVLDRMRRGHEDIAGAITAVDQAAGSLSAHASDDAVHQAALALDALGTVLLPHLREEEDEAMPIVSRLITSAEWDAIEHEHNLDHKSLAELGFEGHWLLDGASDADRATVTGLVPPVPRFVLLHGFAHRYRRRSRACWDAAAHPGRSVQMRGSVAVTVDADIDEVWALVRDVRRVGEWSHECVGAEWIGGSTEAAAGARFRGRNRAGLLRWGRVCEIVSAEPYELVWITVPTTLYPDSSEWRISLERVAGGTRISQRFRVLRAPKVLGAVYATLIPTHRDRTAALTEDLRRLGRTASRHGGSVVH